MNDVILSAQDTVAAVDTNAGLKTIGYGLSTLGPGLGIGIVAGKTVEGMARQLSLIHISEPTRLLSNSYAVFCLKKKTYAVFCLKKKNNFFFFFIDTATTEIYT